MFVFNGLFQFVFPRCTIRSYNKHVSLISIQTNIEVTARNIIVQHCLFLNELLLKMYTTWMKPHGVKIESMESPK